MKQWLYNIVCIVIIIGILIVLCIDRTPPQKYTPDDTKPFTQKEKDNIRKYLTKIK
jgi:hypothetical protein